LNFHFHNDLKQYLLKLHVYAPTKWDRQIAFGGWSYKHLPLTVNFSVTLSDCRLTKHVGPVLYVFKIQYERHIIESEIHCQMCYKVHTYCDISLLLEILFS
jgi:hypothetical protein